jgi:hypothetical protein
MTPLMPKDPEFARLWLPLKGKSFKNNYIGKLYNPLATTITQKI